MLDSLRGQTRALADVHHRFHNNLQVLISLLSLQIDATTDPSQLHLLRETQNRLRAVATVQAQIGITENLSTVHLGDCLKSLLRDLAAIYELGPRVTVETSLADLAVHVDAAVPLTLVANELLSNAFLHAFPGERPGKISMELHYLNPDWAELSVTDDGVGLSQNFELSDASSIGLRIVRALAHQLRATLELHQQGGTTLRLRFPTSEVRD